MNKKRTGLIMALLSLVSRLSLDALRYLLRVARWLALAFNMLKHRLFQYGQEYCAMMLAD